MRDALIQRKFNRTISYCDNIEAKLGRGEQSDQNIPCRMWSMKVVNMSDSPTYNVPVSGELIIMTTKERGPPPRVIKLTAPKIHKIRRLNGWSCDIANCPRITQSVKMTVVNEGIDPKLMDEGKGCKVAWNQNSGRYATVFDSYRLTNREPTKQNKGIYKSVKCEKSASNVGWSEPTIKCARARDILLYQSSDSDYLWCEPSNRTKMAAKAS